jgi:DNA topoisomerase-1
VKLLIVESPNKVKKLASILGAGWRVAASVGHVRDLPEKAMGVAAPDFKPHYELTERGRGVVQKLKGLVQTADEVYLATDPDREGESISWHLQQCLGLRNPRRVSFHEITDKAVQAAIAKPGVINMRVVAAQECRRVLDRIVGYPVSNALSRQTGAKLTAGRVQSVAVRLVVDLEDLIANFKPTQHFGVRLHFAGAQDALWFADWATKPDFVTEEQPYFLDRDFCAAVARTTSVTVADFRDSMARRKPPAPFTTSTLQQAASITLKLKPKVVMDIAQSLFAGGHITYHRTDNPNISADDFPAIAAVASAQGLTMAPALRSFKAPEGAQTGHPGITPTHWEMEEAGSSSLEKSVYRLIRLRAIASQLADAVYDVRTVKLSGDQPVDGKTPRFEARGRVLRFAGWLKLTQGDQAEEGSNKDIAEEYSNPIPPLTRGQSLLVARGDVLEKMTKAPARYTEASLIKKLEAEGIGRPSTFAAIMENITRRNYVRTEKQFLHPTDTGRLVVQSLVGKFSFLNLDFTREIEKDFDRIAAGEATYKGVIEPFHGRLQGELLLLQGAPSAQHACPDCGRPLVHRVKAGKGGYDFWGCSGYRAGCRTSFKDRGGQPEVPQAALEASS